MIDQEVIVASDRWGSKVLPVGSFIRPLQLTYVPQHIIDKFPGFDKERQVFAYTKYGIVPVPKSIVRET